MNARAWCLIGLRMAGLVMLFLALPGVIQLLFIPFYLSNYPGGVRVIAQEVLQSHHLWMFAVGLYLFLGGQWVARQVTRGLGVPGLCARCGYDVRGIEGGRCPECGAKV